MRKGIKWKKCMLRGRPYWTAVASDSGYSLGLPDIQESITSPGWYEVSSGGDCYETLAEAKRAAVKDY